MPRLRRQWLGGNGHLHRREGQAKMRRLVLRLVLLMVLLRIGTQHSNDRNQKRKKTAETVGH